MKKEYLKSIKSNFRTSLPILNYAVVKKGSLQITDLEQWLQIENEETRELDGKFFGNAALKKTGDLNRSMADESFLVEDFPNHHDFILDVGSEIPPIFINALPEFKAYASSDFTSRVSLTGIYLDLSDGIIVATDGHVLRERKINTEFTPQDEKVIVPMCAVDFIKAMEKFELVSAKISEENGNKYLCLEYEDNDTTIDYQAKLVDGPYPEYQKVIPNTKEFNNVNNKTLQKIVGSLAYLVSFKLKYENLPIINFQGDLATVLVDTGYKTVKIETVITDIETNFNYGLLSVILKDLIKLNGDATFCKMPSNLSAFKFTCNNDTFICMPVHQLSDDEIKASEHELEYFEPTVKTVNKKLPSLNLKELVYIKNILWSGDHTVPKSLKSKLELI